MDYIHLGSKINQNDYLKSSIRESIKEITIDTAEKLRYLAKKLDRAVRARYIKLTDIDKTAWEVRDVVDDLTRDIDSKLKAEFVPMDFPKFEIN